MVIRFSHLLMLMSLVAIRFGVGVRIKANDFYKKAKESRSMEIVVSSGTEMTKTSSDPIKDLDVEFKCFRINEFVVISYSISLKMKNNLSFNVATDSNEFRKIKNNQESFEWEATEEKICFVIGSWRPSGEGDIELYFKFIRVLIGLKKRL